MEEKSDKEVKVIDALKKYPRGLSLGEIVKEAGVEKAEVVDILKKLEDDSKIRDSEEAISDKISVDKKILAKRILVKTPVKKLKVKNRVSIQSIEKRDKQIAEQREPIKKVVVNLKEGAVKSGKEYIKTGIEGFDSLFESGIPKGCSILIAGGAGSGKTIFTLQTLVNQASKGKKCFYMSFEENKKKQPGDRGIIRKDSRNAAKLSSRSFFSIAKQS